MDSALNENLNKKVEIVTTAIENQIDEEIEYLDNLKDSDFQTIRAKRLQELKEIQKKKDVWVRNGHGSLVQLSTEKEFFDAIKKSDRILCHFFRDSTFRCKIVDKHLQALAPKHVETRFIKIDVEKSPFLVSKLQIRVLPTMVPIVKGQAKEHIVGFDSLGGTDDFSTEMLEWRLGCLEVINYDGDTSRPPRKDKKPYKTIKSGIRRTENNMDSSDSD